MLEQFINDSTIYYRPSQEPIHFNELTFSTSKIRKQL